MSVVSLRILSASPQLEIALKACTNVIVIGAGLKSHLAKVRHRSREKATRAERPARRAWDAAAQNAMRELARLAAFEALVPQ